MTPKAPTGSNMAVRDIALASKIFIPKNRIMDGTMIMPPPMPKSPDNMPVSIPSTTNPISIIFFG